MGRGELDPFSAGKALVKVEIALVEALKGEKFSLAQFIPLASPGKNKMKSREWHCLLL